MTINYRQQEHKTAGQSLDLTGVDTLLLDLDGTLRPMDEDAFTRLYLGSLSAAFQDSYDPRLMQKTLWESVGLMTTNQGESTNETLLWTLMESRFPGISSRKTEFDAYYRTTFDEARPACPARAGTGAFLEKLKQAGYRLILATNPIFPESAVRQRLRWAGVDPSLFTDITTYENCVRCKPDPAYYREILNRNGLNPAQCVMIGNDTSEDMAAGSLGMQTFLLTDCLLNRKDLDTDQWPHGGFTALMEAFGCHSA